MSAELQTYEKARGLLQERLRQTGKAHEYVEGVGQDRGAILVCTESFVDSGAKIDSPASIDQDGGDVWVIVGEPETSLEQMFDLVGGLSSKTRECFRFGNKVLDVIIKGGDPKILTDLAGEISVEPQFQHRNVYFPDTRYWYFMKSEKAATTARRVLATLGMEIN